MKRKIVEIDETKCNGCGECIPNCHEGALKIVNGKARLVSDAYCDGLGACLGVCPQGAIKIVERQADEFRLQLRQWPIQMHLISPSAPYYQGADVVLAADCTAYALGDFHSEYLKSKALAIACPKLDYDQDSYVQKIRAWFEEAKINTLTVLIMQVPCCNALLGLAQQALNLSKRKVPIKCVIVSLQGEILKREDIS